jgi:hypothetical protein
VTNHVYMAQMILESLLSDTDGLEALRLAQQGLQEDKWGDEYTAAVGQYGMLPSSSWPIEQVAAFAKAHSMIYGGSVAETIVSTRGTPLRDSEREGNAAILADLPQPFSAEVNMRQNNAEGDGILTWDKPARVSLATGLIDRRPDGSTSPLLVTFTIPPGSAVLEIGSSLPSRTLAHLTETGKVARWPYGYSRIRLFVNLDPATLTSHQLDAYIDSIMAHRKVAEEAEDCAVG